MNVAISINEETPFGFLVKDTTGISNNPLCGQFFPSNEQILWSNPRPQDVVILDFITYNKIDEPSTTYRLYEMKSDADYYRYALHYKCDRDGWYTINHLYIYSWNFFLNLLGYDYLVDGDYYVYNNGYFDGEENWTVPYQKFAKITMINKQAMNMEIIDDPNLIYYALSNPTLIGISEDMFNISRLEKCFYDKVTNIFYNKLYTKCGRQEDEIFRDRDMVWMALEIIKYLIKECKYYEAQRILEMIDTCNSFCKELSSAGYRYGSYSRNCNCGTR